MDKHECGFTPKSFEQIAAELIGKTIEDDRGEQYTIEVQSGSHFVDDFPRGYTLKPHRKIVAVRPGVSWELEGRHLMWACQKLGVHFYQD